MLIAWVAAATVYDTWFRFQESKKPVETPFTLAAKIAIAGENVLTEKTKVEYSKYHTFLINSSAYTNSERIFSTESGGQITCLNGMRFLSLFWIILGHTYNFLADRAQFFLFGKFYYKLNWSIF